jgi:flavin reductase
MEADPEMSRQRAMSEARPISTIAVTKETFRDAMSLVGAAVHIVTSDGPAGRVGFTASAVCSVTDAPPTLLVCLNKSASTHSAVAANGVIAVNTLAPEHHELSYIFGGKTPAEQRFAAASWSVGETGAPLLEGALVSFDCRIASAVEVGSHHVLICEVVGIAGLARAEGLVYFNRAYHALGPRTAT